MTSSPSPILLPVAHVLQRQDGDCLVACTAMVLTYLGRPIAYERLLRTLGIQPNLGAPFPNLKALSRLNITVICEQGTLVELYRFLTNGWPCIVAVKTGELGYWDNIPSDPAVVVVGMDATSVYLNDPAFMPAPIQVSLGEFELAWFERGEQFAVLAP